MKKILKHLFIFVFFVSCFYICSAEVKAVSYPNFTVEFDKSDQSVIVAGVPAYDAAGTTRYEVQGNLKFQDVLVESFTYAPEVMPYHDANKMAYIFNWADAEFLLPASGEYVFSAWVIARDATNGYAKIGTSQTVSVTFTYTKADESTNWGPGLPNTTVEAYDLGQLQGKEQSIVIEEEGYTWTILGTDITEVPEENISLLISANPESLNDESVEEFFGDTLVVKFAVEYSGEFGFKATLNYVLGAEYAGKYANLFYANGDGTFEFMEGVIVDESGIATFSFTHASDYVIAVTDESYTGQELNPQEEESVLPEENVSEEGVETSEDNQSIEGLSEESEALNQAEDGDAVETLGDDVAKENNKAMLWWILGGVVVISVVVAGVVIGKKKSKK